MIWISLTAETIPEQIRFPLKTYQSPKRTFDTSYLNQEDEPAKDH
jgi:hypothetical protein